MKVIYHNIQNIIFSGFSCFLIVVFIVSLSISNDFVLFDAMDGNSALFANVLCDIPVLRIS